MRSVKFQIGDLEDPVQVELAFWKGLALGRGYALTRLKQALGEDPPRLTEEIVDYAIARLEAYDELLKKAEK